MPKLTSRENNTNKNLQDVSKHFINIILETETELSNFNLKYSLLDVNLEKNTSFCQKNHFIPFLKMSIGKILVLFSYKFNFQTERLSVQNCSKNKMHRNATKCHLDIGKARKIKHTIGGKVHRTTNSACYRNI